MRQYLGPILTFALALVVLIGLSAAGNVEVYQEDESEIAPKRSSYNAGTTGTRAFYQTLEASQYPVSRWRESYRALRDKAPQGLLLSVGPFQDEALSDTESKALFDWLDQGGNALIVSRFPDQQFGLNIFRVHQDESLTDWQNPAPATINSKSDELIVQPTNLTQGLQGLALSNFATRVEFEPGENQQFPAPPPPKPEPTSTSEQRLPDPVSQAAPTASAKTATTPTTEAAGTAAAEQPDTTGKTDDETADAESSDEKREAATATEPPTDKEAAAKKSTNTQMDSIVRLLGSNYAKLNHPVVHLGDQTGAVLADFTVGKGRVLMLTDPFVIANNGIAAGANLQLALNLVRELSKTDKGQRRFILFDEYHHGYHSEPASLISYFRGTPFWWVLAQLFLLSLLIVYSVGKRFARPLPLPQADRHSPLEFVSSMANLQQAALARDLALENIYPRFKARLCRRLSLSGKATPAEINEAAQRHPQYVAFANELFATTTEIEGVLKHNDSIDDQRLVELVAALRRFNTKLGQK